MYDIEEIQLVAEMDVMNALMDSYLKQSVMLEYATPEVVQESLKDEFKASMDSLKGESPIKKILLFIPKMIGAIIRWLGKCIKSIRNKKNDEIILQSAEIAKTLTDEDIAEYKEWLETQESTAEREKNKKYGSNFSQYRHKFQDSEGRMHDVERDMSQLAYESHKAAFVYLVDVGKVKQFLEFERDAAGELESACRELENGLGKVGDDSYQNFFDRMLSALDLTKDDIDFRNWNRANNDTDIKQWLKEIHELEPQIQRLIEWYTRLQKEFAAGGKIHTALQQVTESDDKADKKTEKVIRAVRRHVTTIVDGSHKVFESLNRTVYDAEHLIAFHEKVRKGNYTINGKRIPNKSKD